MNVLLKTLIKNLSSLLYLGLVQHMAFMHSSLPNQHWQIMDVQLVYSEVQVQEWQHGSMPCTAFLE